MIKKIKFFLTTLALSGSLAIPGVLVPVITHASGTSSANITSDVCGGADLNVTAGTCPDTSGSLNNILHFALTIFSVVVGVIAVIMIVVGGLKYIISGGESSKVSGAKDTILFAIVGLVIVALAQIIVHFVLNNVSHNITGG
jgi:hypothetical protein